jgi:hypothetical protein
MSTRKGKARQAKRRDTRKRRRPISARLCENSANLCEFSWKASGTNLPSNIQARTPNWSMGSLT